MSINSIHKGFKGKFHKMSKKECLTNILPKVQNTTCNKHHKEIDHFWCKFGEHDVAVFYKAYSEHLLHYYSIPKPNRSKKHKQVVIAPMEYQLPYIANEKARNKYLVLSTKNWSIEYNRDFLICGLKSFFSHTGSLKYPVRLLLPDKIERVAKHKSPDNRKFSQRITFQEIESIKKIQHLFKIHDVTPSNRKEYEPHVYLLESL